MEAALVARVEAVWTALARGRLQFLRGSMPDLVGLYRAAGPLLHPEARSELVEQRDTAGAGDARRARRLRAFLTAMAADRAGATALEQRLARLLDPVRIGAERRVPCRELEVVVADTEDVARRRAIEDARIDVIRRLASADRERLGRGREVYEAEGQASHPEIWSKLTGVDLGAVEAGARRILAETEPAHHELLGYELPRRLGLKAVDARAEDRHRLERAPWYDTEFMATDPAEAARRQLADWGWELTADGRIHVDRQLRPADAFGVVVGAGGEGVLATPAGGGWRAWRRLQYAVGRTQQAARVDPSQPFEDRVLRDPAVSESCALLLERL